MTRAAHGDRLLQLPQIGTAPSACRIVHVPALGGYAKRNRSRGRSDPEQTFELAPQNFVKLECLSWHLAVKGAWQWTTNTSCAGRLQATSSPLLILPDASSISPLARRWL